MRSSACIANEYRSSGASPPPYLVTANSRSMQSRRDSRLRFGSGRPPGAMVQSRQLGGRLRAQREASALRASAAAMRAPAAAVS